MNFTATSETRPVGLLPAEACSVGASAGLVEGPDGGVTNAETRAERLIGTETPRWAHIAGVAAAAAGLTSAFGQGEAEILVAASWLHDIGYVADCLDTGFHPLDGARYLRSQGASARLCRLVANHTHAWVEAEARGLADVLAEEFPAERSPVADALTYADLTTGPRGELVTVEERIMEVFERYKPGHVVHESIRRAAPELIATARWVEMRLATDSFR